VVIGGTNEEICFSGAKIDEEHPGRFGRVQNCRLDIEGTLWEVGIHDAVKNRALTSVRVSGLHRAGVRLKPKVFFFHGFIRSLAEIEGTAGGLQCWLMLLRKFGTVQDGGLYFLALEKKLKEPSPTGLTFTGVLASFCFLGTMVRLERDVFFLGNGLRYHWFDTCHSSTYEPRRHSSVLRHIKLCSTDIFLSPTSDGSTSLLTLPSLHPESAGGRSVGGLSF